MRIDSCKSLMAALSIAAGMVGEMNVASAGDVVGWMEITPTGQEIRITGRAYALRPASIEYVLQIERSGRSGKTATKQAGKAEIGSGTVAALSTTSVNIAAQDRLAILLTISSGGQILSTSAVQVGDAAR